MPRLKGEGTESMKGKGALEAFEDAKPNKAGGGSPAAGAGDGGTGSTVSVHRDSPVHGGGAGMGRRKSSD